MEKVPSNLPAVPATGSQLQPVAYDPDRSPGLGNIDLAKMIAGKDHGVAATRVSQSTNSEAKKAEFKDPTEPKNTMDCTNKNGGFCTEESEPKEQHINLGI